MSSTQLHKAEEPKQNFVTTVFQKSIVPQPVENVSRDKKRVEWGVKGLYAQFLWYLMYYSPIHQGIVNTKVKFICAGGLAYDGDAATWDTINKNGNSRYTLNEVGEFITTDNEVGDCYYVLCKRVVGSKIWEFEHLPFEYMQPSVDELTYYYSENWATTRQDPVKTKYREYRSFFSLSQEEIDNMELPLVCVFCAKTRSRQHKTVDSDEITGGFFSIPNYSGGIDSIMTDIEINFFRYAEVRNGYKGGTYVSLNNGVPENQQAADKIVKDLKLDATSREAQGGIVVGFSDDKDHEPSILQLNGNDLDKRYESTEKALTRKIMIAHGVTNPKLFGVMVEGVLSESSDKESFDRFQKTYVQFRQKGIADSLTFLQQKLNKVAGKIYFEPYQLIEDEVVAEEPTIPSKFSEENIVSHFAKVGQPRSSFKVIKSREHTSFDKDDGDDFKRQFFVSKFAAITDLQKSIMELISEGHDYGSIKKALGISANDLSKNLISLDKAGMIDSENGLEVTDKGMQEIVNQETIEVMYTYEKRPDAPDLQPGGESRDFCRELIRLDRVYTREEIDQISAAVDRNVWLYRGGWYHNPNTDKNQPSCRHYWLQNLVVRR